MFQDAMRWTHSHLHSLTIGEHLYGSHIDDYPEEKLGETEHPPIYLARRGSRNHPTHVVEELLTLSVLEPTIGRRQYVVQIAARASRSPSRRVQKVLVTHGQGKRA